MEYIANKNCNWNIYAPIGNTIKLQVTSFLLEGGDKIYDDNANEIGLACNYDWLQIYDGQCSIAANISDKLCADTGMNKEFHSTGNSLYLEFVTDHNGQEKGFKILYEIIPASEGSGTSKNTYCIMNNKLKIALLFKANFSIHCAVPYFSFRLFRSF